MEVVINLYYFLSIVSNVGDDLGNPELVVISLIGQIKEKLTIKDLSTVHWMDKTLISRASIRLLQIKILKKTNTLIFLFCELTCNNKIIASASGIWKILKVKPSKLGPDS